MSETSEDIAPVTLFKGTANELTIEVAGEWGAPGPRHGYGGDVGPHHGPTFNGAPPAPTTPIITITPTLAGMGPQIVPKFQDLFGPAAIPQHIFLPPGPVGPHLLELNIGEDPLKIGDDSTDTPAAATVSNTEVSGAVDVVRGEVLSACSCPTTTSARCGSGTWSQRPSFPAVA